MDLLCLSAWDRLQPSGRKMAQGLHNGTSLAWKKTSRAPWGNEMTNIQFKIRGRIAEADR